MTKYRGYVIEVAECYEAPLVYYYLIYHGDEMVADDLGSDGWRSEGAAISAAKHEIDWNLPDLSPPNHKFSLGEMAVETVGNRRGKITGVSGLAGLWNYKLGDIPEWFPEPIIRRDGE